LTAGRLERHAPGMWTLKFSLSVSARCFDLCAASQHD